MIEKAPEKVVNALTLVTLNEVIQQPESYLEAVGNQFKAGTMPLN